MLYTCNFLRINQTMLLGWGLMCSPSICPIMDMIPTWACPPTLSSRIPHFRIHHSLCLAPSTIWHSPRIHMPSLPRPKTRDLKLGPTKEKAFGWESPRAGRATDRTQARSGALLVALCVPSALLGASSIAC